MIQAKNITYRIGSKTLLNDVSVNYLPGNLNLIIGPNGAGKSTFVKILSHQIKSYKGIISYADKNIKEFSTAHLAKIRSVLSQNTELAFPLKVEEVVLMGRYPHFNSSPTHPDIEICKKAMFYFGIEDMAERNYLSLSGGEKQRVHFARVIAQIWPENTENGQKYLMLDEPLAGLDIYYQLDFMKKLKNLIADNNLLVVGVVHDLNLAAQFADMITLLNRGEVWANGTPEEVLTAKNLKTAYKIEPSIVKRNGRLILDFN